MVECPLWWDACPLPVELILKIDLFKKQEEFKDRKRDLEQLLRFPVRDQNTARLMFWIGNHAFRAITWGCPAIDTEPENEFFPLDVELCFSSGHVVRQPRGGRINIYPIPTQTYHTLWPYDFFRLDREPRIKPFSAPEFKYTQLWK